MLYARAYVRARKSFMKEYGPEEDLFEIADNITWTRNLLTYKDLLLSTLPK